MSNRFTFRPALCLIALGLLAPVLTACNSGGSSSVANDKVTTATQRSTAPTSSRNSGKRQQLANEARAAHKARDFKLAARKFGELTRMVPGHAGYWALLGHSQLALKELPQAQKSLENAAALASLGSHTSLEAFANKHLARALVQKKDYARAENVAERARKLYRKTDDNKNLALMFGMSGIIARKQGNIVRAIANHEQALKLRRDLPDQNAIAMELRQIGLLQHLHFSKLGKAEKPLSEALAIFQRIGDDRGVADVQRVLGIAYSFGGDHDRGIATMKSALAFYRSHNTRKDKIRQAEIMGNLATIYHSKKDLDRSLALQRQALELEISLGLKGTVGANYANIANVLKDKGDIDGACQNWLQAEKQYQIAKIESMIRRMQQIQRKYDCAREVST